MFFNDNASFFNRNQDREKLYLIRLAYTDFNQLRKQENLDLLQKTWQIVKINLLNYFRNYTVSLDTIIDAFKEITLTTNPEFVFQYCPASHRLFSTIAGLFFSNIGYGRENFVLTLPWILGGNLIHEFDHYQLFKEKNLLGNENEIKKLREKSGNKIENKAIEKQIDFLEKCKNNIPTEIHTYLLKVVSWTVDNNPRLDETFKIFSKADMEQSIENEITYYRSLLKLKTLIQY